MVLVDIVGFAMTVETMTIARVVIYEKHRHARNTRNHHQGKAPRMCMMFLPFLGYLNQIG